MNTNKLESKKSTATRCSLVAQVGNLRYLACGSAAVGPFAFAFRCPAVRTFTYPVDRIFPVLQSLSRRQPVSIDIAAMTVDILVTNTRPAFHAVTRATTSPR